MGGFLLDDPQEGGRCFMCLKEISNSEEVEGENENENTSNDLAFRLLTRYLKLDVGGVVLGGVGALPGASSSSAAVGQIDGGGGEVIMRVPLCRQCGVLARSFAELYQRLELLRLRADHVVREIHGVMAAAEQDKDLVEQYYQRRAYNKSGGSGGVGGGELMAASDKFRKEMVRKCSNLGERTMPRVALRRLDSSSKSLKLKRSIHHPNHHHPEIDAGEDALSPPVLVVQESFSVKSEINVGDNNEDIHHEASANNSDLEPTAPRPRFVSADEITFRKLSTTSTGSRVQCSLCSKTMTRTWAHSHKMGHLVAGGKSDHFKCDLCAGSFRHRAALENHKYWKHRSLFFAKHKDRKLSSEQFEKILVTLFDSIEVPQLRKNAYKCIFCDCAPMFHKGRVQNHFIRRHMEQLIPRLMELQNDHDDVDQVKEEEEDQKNQNPLNQVDNEEEEEEDEVLVTIAEIRKPAIKLEPNLTITCSIGGAATATATAGESNTSHIAVTPATPPPPTPTSVCEVCSKGYRDSRSLLEHKIWKHKSLFFQKHKLPQLSSWQFERLAVGKGPFREYRNPQNRSSG